VRRFEEIRVWSPTKTHRDAFVRDAEAHTLALIGAMDSVEQAVSGADVIVLATSSREPVLREAWVADGTHICAVGACRPDQREMEGELVGRARTFVDSRVGAMSEAGDILLAIREGACGADPIAGELGAVVDGQLDGRTSEGEVTLFKSLGMAVEDIAAAHLAYQRATERGLGRGFLL
jgi:ornithine cyclodeaminase